MSLDAQGFRRLRLNELKALYDKRLQDALGPVNTGADSVTGQISAIFSEAVADAYETLQDVYDSMYPSTAEGVSLDGAVSYVGMSRIPASATSVIANCYGAESTFIPPGSLARSKDSLSYMTVGGIISRANCSEIVFGVSTVASLSTYQIILSGTSYSYVSGASATENEILAGLKAAIPTKYATTISGKTLTITSADLTASFSVTLDSKLSISRLASPLQFDCTTLGAYELPVGGLDKMDSSILGWDAVRNVVAGATGRFVESDTELRARHLTGLRVAGAATLRAVAARILQEVPSVTSVSVYENRTNVQDAFGLPPNSFETVVVGGSNADIAQKIFDVKPAGIEPFGNTSVNIVDPNGDVQAMRFSRAVPMYIWIRVNVITLTPEEPLSAAAVSAITQAVLTYGNTLKVGMDVFLQRFYGPIFAATTGIASISVEGALTTSEAGPPTYGSANISIARAQQAVFAQARIAVTGSV